MNLTDQEKRVVLRIITDPDEARKRFADRVVLAKMTLEEAIADVTNEWHLIQEWIASKSKARGSFVWTCTLFGQVPGAVRRAIQEKRK